MSGRYVTWLLFVALLATPAGAQTAETRTLEGMLHVVWGDPEAAALGATIAAPRYRAFLTTDAGESVEIDAVLSSELTAGDLVSLNGRRVRMSGSAPPARLAPFAAGEAFRAVTLEAASATTYSLGAFAVAPVWPVRHLPYAVLLCKFADVADEPLAVSGYEAMYAGGFGGADDFYREVSDGRLDLTGTRVYGWYTLPQPRAFYVQNDRANLNALFNDCTRSADQDVNYAQVVGVAMHFNAFLDCCSWGGTRTATLDGVTRSFATMWNASWARSGTSWHEMGHSVGLPHSGGPYGRTYDSVWDVMSSATSGRYLNGAFGFGGAHFIGYHKNVLGFIPAGRHITVTSGDWQGVIEPHARNANGSGPVLVTLPIADPGRFGQAYTLELRAKTGYDLRLPRAALIIHSIVPGRAEPAQIVDADGDGDANDDGATWTVGESFSDPSAGIQIWIDSLTANGVAVTLRNGAGRGPSLARSGTTIARQFAEAAVTRDSVRVTGVATWRAAKRRAWLALVRSTGADGQYLAYAVDAAMLAPGRYADTIRVYSGAGASIGAPFVVEVVVAPGNDVAALSVVARSDSSRTGVTSPVDSTFLSLAGRYAASSWTVTRSSPRLFIGERQANGSLTIDLTTSTLTGSGSRWIYFRRGPESTPGTTVDTLTVTVADVTPAVLLMVDTLEAFAPVSIQLTRSGGSRRLPHGSLGSMDSVGVSFADPRNATLEWFAVSRRGAINRLRNNRGLGGHTLRWLIDGSQLAGPVSFVDTISVCSTLSTACATYLDTVTFEAAPAELRLSARGSRQTVARGTLQRNDSVYVQVLGATGRTRPWSAVASTTRISFHALDAFNAIGTGTGSAILRWSRSLAGFPTGPILLGDLAPGTYIDTIAVHADGVAGSPAVYIDTLVVTAARRIAGDVDQDGSITTADAQIILRSLVSLPVVNGVIIANGDANCDGRVTAADAQLILQLDVGIPPQGSCLGRPVSGSP